MNLVVCKDYQEMSQKAAAMAAESICAAEEQLISFPGGDTPLGMVEAFVAMVNSKTVDISRTRYVQLDEWVGLGEEDKGSCALFNRLNLINKLRYPFLEVFLINGLANNMQEERALLNSFIERYGPLCLSVLGIGLNGHLGFNEDGVDFDSDAHIIPLSATTKQVMGKYFDRDRNLEYGITQGIRQIMAAKKVILIANGAHKAAILRKAFVDPVTNSVPASILQRHNNCTVIADSEAAKDL
jgi:glucosamine-6-phosphate deaminase